MKNADPAPAGRFPEARGREKPDDQKKKDPRKARRSALSRVLTPALSLTLLQGIPVGAKAEHFALRGRDAGPCGRLLGNAYIVLVFVSTPKRPWTDVMKGRVNTVSLSSVNIMMRQAKRYGAKLDLAFGALDFSVPYEYDKDLKWYHYILENIYHETTVDAVYARYRRDLKQDTVALVFLFNSWDLSHAYVASKTEPLWNEEFCVIFCDTDMHDNYLTHEVLHLYGAIDFYDYDHEGVRRVAEKYFPNSDMLRVSHVVDDLTAYLVGWTDRLSPGASAFLKETEGLR